MFLNETDKTVVRLSSTIMFLEQLVEKQAQEINQLKKDNEIFKAAALDKEKGKANGMAGSEEPVETTQPSQ